MKTLTSSKSSDGAEISEVNGVNVNAPIPGIESVGNLIICDSQLASSFREVKCSKERVKPGHYLQKVLLGKLKSQSVPSLDNDSSVEVDDDRNPSGIEPLDDSIDENKDDWYKTWPDCVDKEKLRNGLKEEAPNDNNETNPYTPRALKDVHLPLAYSPITKQLHLIKNSDEVVGVRGESIKLQPTSHGITLSSLSDVSASTQGDNGEFSSIGNCSLVSEDEGNEKPKKKGLSGVLSRGVFNWKIRDQESWSLFSRSGSSCSEDRRSLGSDQGVVGTSGLIQLERPAWLPAKPPEENQAHREQHDKILSSNRKKDQKEAKLREKLLQQQLKAEDEAAQATQIWTQEIFPKWPTTRNQKRTQELWWQGIPPCVRGKIWKLAIPNDLNLTHDLFFICLSRAIERLKSAAGSSNSIDLGNSESESDRVHTMELIQLDISRTFPHLCIFQKKGPYYEMLHSVLAAYVCYRPDVGYVQGMSFIAAVLILNMDAPDAFICFANLLNKPLHRAFFALDQSVMNAYYSTYCTLLKENLPNLFKHLQECRLTPDLYLLDWVYTIFAKATQLDLASRLWDIFLRDGEEFIFKAAIGILKTFEQELSTMDFLGGSKFLTRLPEDLSVTKLFKCIGHVKTSAGKMTFHQILQSNLSSL
uniref:TBC1 domain family member 14 n=1 Tax=Lygus hesperus TaxID=30085 RepID=A0A146M8P5_LYGHE